MGQTGGMSIELPARWRRTQRWKNTLIYYVIVCAIAVARLFPFWWLRLWGGLLGRVGGLFAVRERKRAVRQLAQAFPDLEPRFHKRITGDMFEHLGISAMELLKASWLFAKGRGPQLSEENKAVLAEALGVGHGVVLVGGHIGNWELLSHAIARAGFPINAIAKPLYDPRLTAIADEARTAFGAKVLWRGKPHVGKDMLRVFKRNEMLGLLIDQDTRVQGAFVPFFGKPAYTPIAAAALAKRFEAPIVLAWSYRYNDGFDVHIERFEYSPEDGVEELTAALTARIEKAIKQRPAQWVWLHDRWRTKPDSAKAATEL